MASAVVTMRAALRHSRRGLVARLLQLLLALGVAVVSYRLAPTDFKFATRFLVAWDGFVLSTLAISWATILQTHFADMRSIVKSLHPSRTWALLLVVTFLCCTVCIVAVLLLLHDIRQLPMEERIEHILVSAVAIVGTWCLMHTLFALHYAHTYFSLLPDIKENAWHTGLVFAGAPPASYWDFVYFAFVVGMTTQTSDVTVTTLRMRRLVLFHSMLSFAFNTTILALSINIISGLL
ncbi:DUF1345 domain-containing protein [Hymenobacter ruber]